MIQLNKKLILASGSPRRMDILKTAGFIFDVVVKHVDEEFPANLSAIEVPKYLAELKSQPFKNESDDNIILTADTVVCLEGSILGKPIDSRNAIKMIKSLSGKKHDVISGVCIYHNGTKKIFADKSEVYFKNLTSDEINFYVKEYNPMDKAGAYGIQEWIGLIGIEKIIGSYYNVMGLPIHLVYNELLKFRYES